MKNLTMVCSLGVLVLLPLAIVIGCAAPAPETVAFPDGNLEEAIRDALDKPAGEAITPVELAGLTELYGTQLGITDLSGIEYCTNLTRVQLNFSKITDITPLASLTKINWLNIGINQINDISPLASLTNLTELKLHGNQISDLSPLSSLTNLTFLRLEANQISDLSPLSSLTNLTYLRLEANQISDLSPLSSLIQLEDLRLVNNRISDLSSLVENSGLAAEDTVYLGNNNLDLSEGSKDLENIRTLEERGVRVDY